MSFGGRTGAPHGEKKAPEPLPGRHRKRHRRVTPRRRARPTVNPSLTRSERPGSQKGELHEKGVGDPEAGYECYSGGRGDLLSMSRRLLTLNVVLAIVSIALAAGLVRTLIVR